MTVPSIKARLDPRIVAARIDRSPERAPGRLDGRDLITPSSHGWTKIFAIRTWLGGPSFPLENQAEEDSSESRNDPQGAGDRHQILEERNIDVRGTQCPYQPHADLIASETSDHAPDSTQ
jgi:hypothetical protein